MKIRAMTMMERERDDVQFWCCYVNWLESNNIFLSLVFSQWLINSNCCINWRTNYLSRDPKKSVFLIFPHHFHVDDEKKTSYFSPRQFLLILTFLAFLVILEFFISIFFVFHFKLYLATSNFSSFVNFIICTGKNLTMNIFFYKIHLNLKCLLYFYFCHIFVRAWMLDIEKKTFIKLFLEIFSNFFFFLFFIHSKCP